MAYSGYVADAWSLWPITYGDTCNFLDAVIVLVTGVLTVWILPLFKTANSGALRAISILRICRLVRLVRVFAKVKMFHEVWQLMRGLTESMRTLFWTIVVISCITYVFAVFGVVLISSELQKHIEDSPDAVTAELESLMSLFNGIFCTMQTLIQVLFLDSVHGILHPLMNYVGWSWLFFYAYISVAVIVLLNLVTAIIVDNAIAKSRLDERHELAQKECHKKQMLDQFRSLFECMDLDGNGLLTWSEFESAFDVPEVATKLKMLEFDRESLRELFHLLDNGDGSLSLGEFFEGISNMDGGAKAKDSFKLLKVTATLQRSLQQLANDIQEDHNQLLQHTPGCNVVPRAGSLRSRSCKDGDSSVVSSPSRIRSARGEEQPPLPDVPPPALGTLRRLPRPLAAASRESSVDSVGTDGDVSPAMKASRRKRLGLDTSCDTEGPSSGMTLKHFHDLAEQMVLCNEKVDFVARSVSEVQANVACSISQLQSSMALVLQRLDGPQQVRERQHLPSPPEVPPQVHQSLLKVHST